MIWMMAERKTSSLNPSPIWIIVGGAKECIGDVLLIEAAKKNLQLFPIPLHHLSINHDVSPSMRLIAIIFHENGGFEKLRFPEHACGVDDI
jgi:hypothetical protein